jgi:hypothetical protein
MEPPEPSIPQPYTPSLGLFQPVTPEEPPHEGVERGSFHGLRERRRSAAQGISFATLEPDPGQASSEPGAESASIIHPKPHRLHMVHASLDDARDQSRPRRSQPQGLRMDRFKPLPPDPLNDTTSVRDWASLNDIERQTLVRKPRSCHCRWNGRPWWHYMLGFVGVCLIIAILIFGFIFGILQPQRDGNA